MAILGNYKTNDDTETTTANNSMGFDPSVIQSCSRYFCLVKMTVVTDRWKYILNSL